MGGTIAATPDVGRRRAHRRASRTARRRQYPGDAEPAPARRARPRRAAAELGVTDYVHLDLPDMRLDTLAHVEVNRAVEEHVRDLRPDRSSTTVAPGRQPRPPRAVRLGRRGHAAGAGPVRAPRADLRADLQHRVDAGADQLVRAQLVRRRHERRSSTRSRPSRCYETEARDWPHPRTSARCGPTRRSTAPRWAARRPSRSCWCGRSRARSTPRRPRPRSSLSYGRRPAPGAPRAPARAETAPGAAPSPSARRGASRCVPAPPGMVPP